MSEEINNENKKGNKTLKVIDWSLTKFYAFKFSYIGKNYEGLVTQNHTKKTVEEQIFYALKKAYLIKDIDSCNYSRCGRTDAGVSSTGNIFSCNVRYKPTGEYDYVKILNNILPDDINIIASKEVDRSFDARFSCLYREYKYFFLKGPMDIEEMKKACTMLQGVHNFKNFCKIDKSNPKWMSKNYERRIYEFRIEKFENQGKVLNNDRFEVYIATIKGSAFLWHQVRCMMGILFLIGKKQEDLEIITNMFDVENQVMYNYEIASDLNLILTDCQFEGVDFECKEENIAESYFCLEKFYEENFIQLHMDSFFINNMINYVRPHIQEKKDNDGDIIQLIGKKHRKTKQYTKMLEHRTNKKVKNPSKK
jgi:tRNA pseudouridine38/39 synthase